MYDLKSNNPNAVIDYEGIPKNVTSIGFQEDGKWMYSGGEDKLVRIWDLRSSTQQCPKSFEGLAPITSVYLHPNQGELFIGDQSGYIYRWDMRTDNNEQLVSDIFTIRKYIVYKVTNAIILKIFNFYISSLNFLYCRKYLSCNM